MVDFPWLTCSGSDYSKLIGATVFFGILYCFGIPVVFGILLYRNRNTIDTKWTQEVLGFFYVNYHSKYFYMEIVWIIRNLVIAMGFSLFKANTAIQGKK